MTSYTALLQWSLAQTHLGNTANVGEGGEGSESESDASTEVSTPSNGNNNNHANQPSRELRRLDPERASFLKEALSSMVADPIADMKMRVEVLRVPEHEALSSGTTDTGDDGATPTKEQVRETKENALLELSDYAEQIDLARDLMLKLGGLDEVIRLLCGISYDAYMTQVAEQSKDEDKDNERPIERNPDRSPEYANIRARACGLIATTAQNNPPVQSAMGTKGVLDLLIAILTDQSSNNNDGGDDSSSSSTNRFSDEEKAKAMSALSACVRSHAVNTRTFIKDHKGLKILFDLFRQVEVSVTADSSQESRSQIAIKRKAVFLLRYIFEQYPGVLAASTDTFTPVLVACINHTDIDVRGNGLHIAKAFCGDYWARQRMSPDHESQLKGAAGQLKSSLSSTASSQEPDDASKEHNALAQKIIDALKSQPSPPNNQGMLKLGN